MHYFCHGIQQHLRTTPLYDPDLDASLRRALVRWANDRRPLILIINHYGGGGTERHVRDLVKASAAQARFLQLTPKRDGTVIVSGAGGYLRAALTFDPRAQSEEFVTLLQECNVDRVHIHHSLGNEHYLRNLVQRLGKPFDFTAHDYYALAPSRI